MTIASPEAATAPNLTASATGTATAPVPSEELPTGGGGTPGVAVTPGSGGASGGGSGGQGEETTGSAGTSVGGTVHAGDSFAVEVELASEIDASAPTTVGIVTWATSGVTPTEAFVEFGLDTEYGMTAPVDLTAPEYRTVLLGMKPERSYHFRIVARADGQSIASDDYTVETGSAPPSPLDDYAVLDPSAREPGFIILSFWRGQGAQTAYIIDTDGDVVWWHDSGINGLGRAIMSADGKSLWMITADNMGAPLRRVTMDGLESEIYSDVIGSHDIYPVAGGTMVFLEYGEPDCDSAFEIDEDGSTREVFELNDYLSEAEDVTGGIGGSLACHGNTVRYSATLDTYVLSSLTDDVFIFPRSGDGDVVRLGQLVSGGNAAWGGTQHGTHQLADSIVIFANDEGSAMGGFRSGGPSTVIEYSLLDGQELWRYGSDQYSQNLGDVQRLPGGNTLVTYSNAGIVREITPDQQVAMEFDGAGEVGYTHWRPTLYGPPPSVQ